jgi:flagellar assembly protein FliH
LSAEILVRPARFPSFLASEEVTTPSVPPPRPPVVAQANEAELVREAARREGLARGHEDGVAAALAEWTPRLTALAAALDETIATVRAERERLAAELTDALPEVALDLARKVVEREELATAAGDVRAALAPVVRRLAQSGGAALRVAPDIAAALQAWRGEVDAPPAIAGVTIRADESLRRGDWIIEMDGGLLDGRVATRFAEATRVLLEPDA